MTVKNQPAPTASQRPNALTDDDILEHAAWLRSFALALVRDPNQADDLVQEALVAVAAAPGRIHDPRGYLAGIVRWRAWKERRSAARRRRRDGDRVRDAAGLAPAADESLEAMDRMRVVLEEVAKLPRSQATAISLRFIEELSPADIAMIEGTSPSTVRSNLARGLATLRQRLDERYGGRANWCAVFVPWSLRAPGDAATAASGSSVPGVAAPTSPLKTTASLVASAMSLKLVSLIILPVALAALWFISDNQAVDVQLSEVAPEAPQAASAVAGQTRPGGAAVTTLADLVASDARTAERPHAGPTAEENVPVDVRLAGRLVDQETGEGIGDVMVALTPGGADISSWTATHNCMTLPDGSFKVDETVPEGTSVRIAVRERQGYGGRRIASPLDLDFPLAGDVRIPIGPTFRFDLGEVDAIRGLFDVEARGPGLHASRPATSQVMLGLAPWTRFREPLAKPGTRGPWELRILSRDGLSVGTCTVDRRVGIEPSLVPVRFERTAAIEFVLPPEVGTVPTFRFIEVSNDAGFERTIELRVSSEGRVYGWIRHLKPGTYRWSTPIVRETEMESVDLLAGAITRVELQLDSRATEQRVAVVDATAAPGVNLSTWGCVVFETSAMENRFELRPTPAPALGPDMWQVSLGSTPTTGWTMALRPEEDYEVDQFAISLDSSKGPPTIRVIRRSMPVEVTLVAVDAETGEPLPGSKAVHFDGMNISSPITNESGGFEPHRVSSARGTYFLVRKNGYRLTLAEFEPGRDGTTLRVQLEKGWRNRVVAVRASDMAFLAGVGVHIDGELVGETGPDGTLWIEGEGPPERIELARSNVDLRVTLSPFDHAERGAGDPLQGYLFLLAPTVDTRVK